MSASCKRSLPKAIAVFLFLSAVVPCFAVKGVNPDGTLDKPTISKAYFEGEFWTVINALEAFRKGNPKISREDSVYTFKYLSVVYAAEPTTRVKAESYMYQLIRMMPTIDLLDLYISDNIQSIFVKVKSDYEKIESHKTAEPAPGNTAAVSHPAPTAPQHALSPAAPQAAPAPAAVSPAASHATASQSFPSAPEKPDAEEKPNAGSRLKIWAPLALSGVGVAAAAFLMFSSDAESGSQARTPREVDVTLEWPKEGSR